MKCPGQDSRYWKHNAIFEADCPKCSKKVEFFKDDTTRKCDHCGHIFINPNMDFGCASYCEFANQCIGTLPPELIALKENLLKDRVAIEMKKYFKDDFKRIGHATRVARYAERIGKKELGNMVVIIAASYLHDIGIHEAERKYNSISGKYQEIEGHPIARSILLKLGAAEKVIEEVCDIVGHHHHPREEETLNYKVLYDSDLIVNLEEMNSENRIETDRLKSIIEKSFFTDSGKNEAQKSLLNLKD